ncbi:hypothetical protein ACIU1J_27560 [Azospirillum doebereinerae]|uniref:hypothetical protein n=1 Tax=Azospirillum doebereinerae TaxID=92933 RepID=UPI001EE5DC7D|nr:hypothetical protein [Azospirillum doebereinerae]MCG5241378.1 hypothetical protein [Azospirillum doebereinerae]
MNITTAAIVGAAWKAGNCCLIGMSDSPETFSINTPTVKGVSAPVALVGAMVPPFFPANTNRPAPRPVA